MAMETSTFHVKHSAFDRQTFIVFRKLIKKKLCLFTSQSAYPLTEIRDVSRETSYKQQATFHKQGKIAGCYSFYDRAQFLH